MNSLTKTNNFLAKAFFYLLLAILLANVAGIIFQFKRTAEFMERNPDGRNNLGIFLAGWMIAEVYFLIMLFAAWGVRHLKNRPWLKLVLLILIFCIAVAPGVYFAIGVFLKK